MANRNIKRIFIRVLEKGVHLYHPIKQKNIRKATLERIRKWFILTMSSLYQVAYGSTEKDILGL